jgi:hypothetical protein
MIFFEVVDHRYLNDGTVIVAEEFGVLLDVDNMVMNRVMSLVTAAGHARERRMKKKSGA